MCSKNQSRLCKQGNNNGGSSRIGGIFQPITGHGGRDGVSLLVSLPLQCVAMNLEAEPLKGGWGGGCFFVFFGGC